MIFIAFACMYSMSFRAFYTFLKIVGMNAIGIETSGRLLAKIGSHLIGDFLPLIAPIIGR